MPTPVSLNATEQQYLAEYTRLREQCRELWAIATRLSTTMPTAIYCIPGIPDSLIDLSADLGGSVQASEHLVKAICNAFHLLRPSERESIAYHLAKLLNTWTYPS